jgi:hypothetical protein
MTDYKFNQNAAGPTLTNSVINIPTIRVPTIIPDISVHDAPIDNDLQPTPEYKLEDIGKEMTAIVRNTGQQYLNVALVIGLRSILEVIGPTSPTRRLLTILLEESKVLMPTSEYADSICKRKGIPLL